MTNDLTVSLAIARAAADLGGRAYFVGGCVRDACLGIESKDIDLEIHGISPAQLRGILDSLGGCTEKGSAFGVFGLPHSGMDIAMPRTETATGSGHRDFEVCIDPYLGTEKAASRRDFTVNAMMRDVLTGEIIDCFGGKEDLKNGILRHVNEKSFREDALRVLRLAQFAARFGFTPAPETVALCRTMDLSALAKERVLAELEKAMLKAEKPSVFFEVLDACDGLEVWFPEVKRLQGIPQDPARHPEGDVYRHTMLVLDRAAKCREQARDRFAFMLSALMHDYGKITATAEKNGVLHAYGHEEAGLPIVENAIKRITNEQKRIRYVLNMTKLHMKPNILAADMSSVKATNRLFDSAVCPEDLLLLAECDDLGKERHNAEGTFAEFLRQRLALYREYMARPYVTGADLIAQGFKPGAAFSEAAALSRKLRLAGTDKEDALRQCTALLRKKYKKEGILMNTKDTASSGRLTGLAALLPSFCDAALILSPENRQYLTAFPCSDGILFLTRDGFARFYTDSRYTEAAAAAVTVCPVENSEKAEEKIIKICKDRNLHTIAIENDRVSVYDYNEWRKKLPGLEVLAGDELRVALCACRCVKTEDEIAQVIAAQRIAEAGFDYILGELAPGKTEREIQLALDHYLLSHGAQALSFETICVSGANSSMPHGVPSDRKIEKGDFVTFDFGAVVNGYHSDMTRTVLLGKPTERQKTVYETVLCAQQAALAVLRDGVSGFDADKAARDVITQAGFGACFGHGTGHGVGIEIHEAPRLSVKSTDILHTGNIVTVEPGIYLPGEFGVRIEDMALITQTGCRDLTGTDKALLTL